MVMDVITGGARDVARISALTAGRLRGGNTGKLLNPRLATDPYPTYEWIRSEGVLVPTALGPMTVDHELCNALLRHPKVMTANARRHQLIAGDNPFQRWVFGRPDREHIVDTLGTESMIGVDGENHVRLRRLTKDFFTPAAVQRLRPQLERTAEDLLSTARAEGNFDLMTGFAIKFPVIAVCDLLGIPAADRELFRRWGRALSADIDAIAMAPAVRAADKALQELQDYFISFLAWRRANPADDVLSQLLQQDDIDATPREMLALTSLLVMAGFETTMNLIGNGTMALTRHPEQWEMLRENPELIPHAVEELLRIDPPIQTLGRIVDEEIEVAGQAIPPGVMISVMLAGANRDPKVFKNPAALDITRSNARKHLAFAAGPHHCLGAPLARLEGDIAFRVLTQQVPRLQLAGRPKRRRTFVLRGFSNIPLVA